MSGDEDENDDEEGEEEGDDENDFRNDEDVPDDEEAVQRIESVSDEFDPNSVQLSARGRQIWERLNAASSRNQSKHFFTRLI